jgi:hypothetical protein
MQLCFQVNKQEVLKVKCFHILPSFKGARDSVVVKPLCYKPEGCGYDTRWGDCLILPAALGPGVHSASNRNEYQKHENNNVSGE